MHIVPPVTAEGFDGSHHPRFAECWRSRQATAPDTPTCIVIHDGHFTGGVHPPNQFVPEIVSPLPFSPALVRHTLLIVLFFKELFLSSAPLTNATTAFLTL